MSYCEIKKNYGCLSFDFVLVSYIKAFLYILWTFTFYFIVLVERQTGHSADVAVT